MPTLWWVWEDKMRSIMFFFMTEPSINKRPMIIIIEDPLPITLIVLEDINLAMLSFFELC